MANAFSSPWISSLYTVIPNNSGVQALTYFLDKRPVFDPPTYPLSRLAELALSLHVFTFNGEFYKQVGGGIYPYISYSILAWGSVYKTHKKKIQVKQNHTVRLIFLLELLVEKRRVPNPS